MNVFAKFDEIPSLHLQNIKDTKRYGHTFVLSVSSIGPGIAPRTSQKWRPRWPPWPPNGRDGSKMAAITSRDDSVTRSGVCHALDHGRNGLGPEY